MSAWHANYAIMNEDIDILTCYLAVHPVTSLLEFGPGRSTKFFAEQGLKRIVTFEHDTQYIGIANNHLGHFPAVKIYRYFNDNVGIAEPEGLEHHFDLGFVDGPSYSEPFSRAHSCDFVSRRCKAWFLHDSARDGEKMTLERFKQRGWKVTQYPTPRGLALVEKGT